MCRGMPSLYNNTPRLRIRGAGRGIRPLGRLFTKHSQPHVSNPHVYRQRRIFPATSVPSVSEWKPVDPPSVVKIVVKLNPKKQTNSLPLLEGKQSSVDPTPTEQATAV